MAKTFDRKLNPDLLTLKALRATPLLRHLLALWAPAGSNGPAEQGLRLAIRDTYVNFYAQGQSLAQVKFYQRERNLAFRVHKSYCDAKQDAKDYVSVDCGASAADLRRWRDTALGHDSKKAEKVFVDQLVGANANVIDVEMALPAPDTDDASVVKTAPRADLVLLEPCDGGHRIVFWESKLSTNPEARAQGEAAPKVSRQLQTYKDWFIGDRPRQVVDAYRRACELFVQFHELAKSVNPDIAPLGEAIKAVAAGDGELWLDTKVRLVIDDRAFDEKGTVKASPLSPSFVGNGHEAKLRAAGTPLQMIRPNDSLLLPVLA